MIFTRSCLLLNRSCRYRRSWPMYRPESQRHEWCARCSLHSPGCGQGSRYDGSTKAPGPDSFTVGFFQSHWASIGPSVTNAVLHFLNGGQMPEGVNQMTIVLIPKIKNHISLCIVIYKLCSKVLANRLRGFLDEIISGGAKRICTRAPDTGQCACCLRVYPLFEEKKGKDGNLCCQAWYGENLRSGWMGIFTRYYASALLLGELCDNSDEMCHHGLFLSAGEWSSFHSF